MQDIPRFTTEINVIASGSKGNCTAVTIKNPPLSKKEKAQMTILLDVGTDFKRLQQALNFENPTACFLTHEHGDHANKAAVNELLKRGVEVYMTPKTIEALQLEPRHNLLNIVSTVDIKKDFSIFVHAMHITHDAASPVCFLFYPYGSQWQERMLYITDAGAIPADLKDCAFDPLFRKIIIEANHSETALLTSDIDEHQKQRILNNHLSIEKAAEFIDGCAKDFLEEVHLIHISKRHGNAERFREMVQNIVGDKVKVFAH